MSKVIEIAAEVEKELKEVFTQELGAADPNTMAPDELVDRMFSAMSKVMALNIMQAANSVKASVLREVRAGPTIAAPPKNIIIPGRG